MRRFFKIAKYPFYFLLLLVLFLFGLVQLAPVQRQFAELVIDKVLLQRGITSVEFERLKIGLNGKVSLYRLRVADAKYHEIAFVEKFAARVGFVSLLKNELAIKSLSLKGVRGQLYRFKDNSLNIAGLIQAKPGTEKNHTKKKLTIDLGHIELKNIDFRYHDSVSAVYLDIKLGYFFVDLHGSNLNALSLLLDKMELKDTEVQLIQDEPLAIRNPEEKNIEKKAPQIQVGNILLSKVHFYMLDNRDKSSLSAGLVKLSGNKAFVDIGERNIKVKSISLHEGSFLLNDLLAGEVLQKKELNPTESPREISFSGGWTIAADRLKGKNNQVSLLLEEKEANTSSFSPQNFSFEGIDFDIRKASVRDTGIVAQISGLTCHNADGFRLLNASIDAAIHKNMGRVVVHKLATGRSNLKFELDAFLPLLHPDIKNLKLNKLLADGDFAETDLKYFMPSLTKTLPWLKGEVVTGKLNLSGSGETLTLSEFEIGSTSLFTLKAKGAIQHYQSLENAAFLFDTIQLVLTEGSPMVSTLADSLAGSIPEIRAALRIGGRLDSVGIQFYLTDLKGFSEGSIQLSGDSLHQSLEAQIILNEIQLERFIKKTPSLVVDGNMVLTADLLGWDSISNATLDLCLSKMEIDTLLIDTVLMTGNFSAGNFQMELNHQSELTQLNAKAMGTILPDQLAIVYQTEIVGFDVSRFLELKQKGLVDAKIAGMIRNSDSLHSLFNANCEFLRFRSKEKEYQLNQLNLAGHFSDNYFSGSFSGEGVKLELESNIAFNQIGKTLKDFLANHIDPIQRPAGNLGDQLILQCQVQNSYNLQHLLSVLFFDSLLVESAEFHFHLQQELLKANISIPYLAYKGLSMARVSSNVYIDSTLSEYKFELGETGYKKLRTSGIKVEARGKDNELQSIFQVTGHSGSAVLILPLNLSRRDSILFFSVNDSIQISGKNWHITQPEILRYNNRTNRWSTRGVNLAFENQSIQLEENASEIRIKLNKLNLAMLTNFVSMAEKPYLTSGILSGELAYRLETEKVWLFHSVISISEIGILGRSIGNLKSAIDQLGKENTRIQLDILNRSDYLNFSGSLGNLAEKKHQAKISIENVTLYSGLFDSSNVAITQGGLLGELAVEVLEEGLNLKGNLHLKNNVVRIPTLGMNFKIGNEEIQFSRQGMHFDDLDIYDETGNRLRLSGNVFTSNYSDVHLNLRLLTDRFQLMNTQAGQNNRLFGKFVLGADLRIEGSLKEPKIEAKLNVHNETNLTLMLPEKDPLQAGNEGVINFRERDQTISDSTFIASGFQQVRDSLDARFSLGPSSIVLSFDPSARYTIITDPRSGDFARFGLNGALQYRTLQNSLFELSGNIQVVEGLYQMSFYQMVQKDFTIVPQSTIYFSGPLNNATIDLKAMHIVRTNSLALMSGESIGNSPQEKALYNQRLPYELYFNVSGLLLSPEVSFSLDLPVEYKKTSPMIASKLDKLAGPESEQERNMQVFALLVTGGFIAQNAGSGGSGSSDVASATARNSINSILSQQLNNIMSDNIQFFDVNMGLNTYEDYARKGGQTTTDLDVQISKNLFEDRVSLQMESRINLSGNTNPGQSSSNYNTDYKFFYNIDKNGTYKLKAYNLAIYDLFDGDITNTGIGILYSKDFDSKKRKNYVEVNSSQTIGQE